mgnify:CR=1 FL=1
MLENSYPIRTDLALESQERLQEDQADMRGIRVLEERRENGVIVSTVMIETENASVAMGRPKDVHYDRGAGDDRGRCRIPQGYFFGAGKDHAESSAGKRD